MSRDINVEGIRILESSGDVVAVKILATPTRFPHAYESITLTIKKDSIKKIAQILKEVEDG